MFSIHFSRATGSAGSKFVFEIIQSDSFTKGLALPKQESPGFLPTLSVSLTSTAQLQGGASGCKVWEALLLAVTQRCCIRDCLHLICEFQVCSGYRLLAQGRGYLEQHMKEALECQAWEVVHVPSTLFPLGRAVTASHVIANMVGNVI